MKTSAPRCSSMASLGVLPPSEAWGQVDFVVIKDGAPWFVVEAKYRDESISAPLKYFQGQIKAPLAFQVVIESDYVEADCFARQRGPVTVPARTFFSQLL